MKSDSGSAPVPETPTPLSPSLEADWDTFCAIEDEVGKAETSGIEARWRCGRLLLSYEKRERSKSSPLAQVIRSLSGEFGVSEAELYNRRQFAEEYENCSTAVEQFGSWTELRDSLGKRGNVHFSSETGEWSTPQDLFDLLDSEFGFDTDVCATHENAKCERYFTAAEDGLAQEWSGVCWMNPPYGEVIGNWVRKAWESAKRGTTVVCLLPARVDTGWWWEFVRYGEIRFLRGRLKFGGGETSAPFPSAVVVFPRHPRVVWWGEAA